MGEKETVSEKGKETSAKKVKTVPHDGWLTLGKVLLHFLMWGQVLFLVLFWGRIPDRVPTHYGLTNNVVTRWGGKSALVMLPICAFLVLYLFYFFAAYLVRLSGPENIYSNKGKEKVTEADLRYGRLLLQKMLVWLTDWCLLLFAWITVMSALCAEYLPVIVFWSLFTVMGVQICYYMGRLWKKRKQILAS